MMSTAFLGCNWKTLFRGEDDGQLFNLNFVAAGSTGFFSHFSRDFDGALDGGAAQPFEFRWINLVFLQCALDNSSSVAKLDEEYASTASDVV